ncbi:hypothetical protein ACFRMO_07690 [Streptomyces anulatus]|uniref:hypothetical protein n=1 Tax=Streptomyces anulatus TaxID=1892 RepID=UPI00369A5D41
MDFNTDQFRQPGTGQGTFRGYGDQGMRRYRVTPPAPQNDAPTSTAGPEPAASPGWTQPQLPTAPTRAAAPARLSPAAQARADISAARAQARTARVATARANATAAGHRQTLAESRAAQAQQRAAQATNTRPAADPSSVPDNSPRYPASTPAGPGRTVTINSTAYRNAGPSRPASPAPAAAPPHVPATPPRPSAPPAAGPGPSARPATRALPLVGTAVTLAGRSLQGITKIATDPKRSGNPLYKTSRGWNQA